MANRSFCRFYVDIKEELCILVLLGTGTTGNRFGGSNLWLYMHQQCNTITCGKNIVHYCIEKYLCVGAHPCST